MAGVWDFASSVASNVASKMRSLPKLSSAAAGPHSIPAVLGIDMGSTYIRATLWHASRQDPIAVTYSAESLFHTSAREDIVGYCVPWGQGPCLFGPRALIDPLRISLKIMSMLLSTDRADERKWDRIPYGPLLKEIVRDKARLREMRDKIRSALGEVLGVLAQRANEIARKQGWEIGEIAYAVPDWMPRKCDNVSTLDDFLDELLMEAFKGKIPKDKFHLVMESHAVMHCLFRQDARSLEQALKGTNYVLFFDNGGSALNGCACYVAWQTSENSEPSFYTRGHFGAVGGSEMMRWCVGEEIRKRLKDIKELRMDDAKLDAEHKKFLRYLVESPRHEDFPDPDDPSPQPFTAPGSPYEIFLDGNGTKTHKYALRKCYEAAFRPNLKEMDENIKYATRRRGVDFAVVMSGGSAKCAWFRREIKKIVAAHRKRMSRKASPSPGSPNIELFWTSSMGSETRDTLISRGSAYSIAFKPTIASWIKDARFGLQVIEPYVHLGQANSALFLNDGQNTHDDLWASYAPADISRKEQSMQLAAYEKRAAAAARRGHSQPKPPTTEFMVLKIICHRRMDSALDLGVQDIDVSECFDLFEVPQEYTKDLSVTYSGKEVFIDDPSSPKIRFFLKLTPLPGRNDGQSGKLITIDIPVWLNPSPVALLEDLNKKPAFKVTPLLSAVDDIPVARPLPAPSGFRNKRASSHAAIGSTASLPTPNNTAASTPDFGVPNVDESRSRSSSRPGDDANFPLAIEDDDSDEIDSDTPYDAINDTENSAAEVSGGVDHREDVADEGSQRPLRTLSPLPNPNERRLAAGSGAAQVNVGGAQQPPAPSPSKPTTGASRLGSANPSRNVQGGSPRRPEIYDEVLKHCNHPFQQQQPTTGRQAGHLSPRSNPSEASAATAAWSPVSPTYNISSRPVEARPTPAGKTNGVSRSSTEPRSLGPFAIPMQRGETPASPTAARGRRHDDASMAPPPPVPSMWSIKRKISDADFTRGQGDGSSGSHSSHKPPAAKRNKREAEVSLRRPVVGGGGSASMQLDLDLAHAANTGARQRHPLPPAPPRLSAKRTTPAAAVERTRRPGEGVRGHPRQAHGTIGGDNRMRLADNLTPSRYQSDPPPTPSQPRYPASPGIFQSGGPHPRSRGQQQQSRYEVQLDHSDVYEGVVDLDSLAR